MIGSDTLEQTTLEQALEPLVKQKVHKDLAGDNTILTPDQYATIPEEFLGYLKALSFPHLEEYEQLTRVLVTSYYKELVLVFCAQHAASQGHASLIQALKGWAHDSLGFDAVWHQSFGLLRKLMSTESAFSDLPLVMAGLALRLAEMGQQLQWQGTYGQAHTFVLGTYILPASTKISVSSTATEIAVTLGQGMQYTFTKVPEGLRLVEGELPEVLPVGVGNIVLCPQQAVNASEYPTEYDKGAGEVTQQDVEKMREGFALIEKYAPNFAGWITLVARNLFVLNTEENGNTLSGSDAHRPGGIYFTRDQSPLFLAETLVHECTHQYLNVALLLDELFTPEDKAIYYSSFRRKNRPLKMLLVAYHAFVNVLLLFFECQGQGYDENHYAQENLDNIPQLLPEVAIPLARHEASMSQVGRALFRPLYDLFDSES